MSQVGNHVVKEADGYHSDIPVRIDEIAFDWSNGEESVFCRRVGDQWQALVVRGGTTRTLLAGLGSKNHVLWHLREYMEFGRTYGKMDVWSKLPSRERSNPFRDILSSSHSSPLP